MAITTTPASLDFGDVKCQETKDLTIKLDFGGKASGGTIAATGKFTVSASAIPADSGDLEVTVSFSPDAIQTETGTLDVSANIGSGTETASIALTGNGLQNIVFAPDPVEFGDVAADAKPKLNVKISCYPKLTSAADLSIASPFTVDKSKIVANKRNTFVKVTFEAPSSVGGYQTDLKAKAGSDTFTTRVSGQVAILAPAQSGVAETYLLIKVPDYGDTTFAKPATGVDGTKLESFLRLGAFDYDDEPPAAKKLLKQITQAHPATNPSNPDPGTSVVPDDGGGLVFVDDVRKRPQDMGGSFSASDDPDHGLSQTDRQNESSLLYSRGGWRDHSDGNRISTTWGDKVEVVRGNYKMIVLGRNDDAGQAMGWEASGAHIQDYAPGTMPGASYWLEWIDDYHAGGQKGVWLLVNTTENVYEYARNAGNFREEVWGDVNEAYVGSATPPLLSPAELRDAVKDLIASTDDSTLQSMFTGSSRFVMNPTPSAGEIRTELQNNPLTDSELDLLGKALPITLIRKDKSVASGSIFGTGGHLPPIRLPDRNYDYPGSGDGDRSTPPWNLDNEDLVRSNPHIIEKTWATRIDSHTGSVNCPVPQIHEETWADMMFSTTGSLLNPIKKIDEKQHALEVHSLSTSTLITEVELGVAKISTATYAANITENTNAATILGFTNAAGILETTVSAVHVEAEASLAHISIDLLGIIEIFLGYKFAFDLSGTAELTLVEAKDLKAKKTDLTLEKTETILKAMATHITNEDISWEDTKTAIKADIKATNVNLGL